MTVAIIGLGLIGGSLALSLKANVKANGFADKIIIYHISSFILAINYFKFIFSKFKQT